MRSYPSIRLWEAELRAGVNGQDRLRPSTWVWDSLFIAACYETNAKEYDADADRYLRTAKAAASRTERLLAEHSARIWRAAADDERGKASARLAREARRLAA